MKGAKIDIKSGSLFPWQFQFLGAIVFVIGLALIFERTLLSILLLFASVFILSAYSGTEINKQENVYREYMSFFLIKSGKQVKFGGIDKIFINSSKITQRFHSAHTTQSSIFTSEEFNAYLKFDDGTKIHLVSKRNKKRLNKMLEKTSAFLHVPVVDNTVVAS